MAPAAFVGFQPTAVVDLVKQVDAAFLSAALPGEVGGSTRVDEPELNALLESMGGGVAASAGGSAANTCRALAGLDSSFGVRLVGGVGGDAWGDLFRESLSRAGVDLSSMRHKDGPTGRCVCLVSPDGQRTMRPCLSESIRLHAPELRPTDVEGAQWALISGYGFYGPDFPEAASQLARAGGAKVILDLASFEVVRRYRGRIGALLDSGGVDLLVGNDDEFIALAGDSSPGTPRPMTSRDDVDAAFATLRRRAPAAVVTLGEAGCLAGRRTVTGEDETARCPAATGVTVADTTGAGDAFCAGFCWGLLRGESLARCCALGNLAGGACVSGLGAEISATGWAWLRGRIDRLGLAPAGAAETGGGR